MTTEQDQLVTQTESQRDCYRARPEDFEVITPDAIASRTQPFHGQRGESDREEAKLLAIRKSKGQGVDLPTATDKAGPPRIASRKLQ